MGTAFVLGTCVVGLLLMGGCDRLPWSSETEESDALVAASPTAESSASFSRPFVRPDEIVATVNGVPISETDLELRIEEVKVLYASAGEPWEPLAVESPEGLLSLTVIVEELVSNELLRQAAVARGLDRNTETQRRWAFLRRGFFAQEWLRWHEARQEVTSDQVNQYYEQFRVGFREPERLRLRQLTVASEDRARQALVQLHEGIGFETMSQQISIHPRAGDGGLLEEWVMRADEKAAFAPVDPGIISLDPVLESAAFAIDEPNRVSNYVKGPDGQFHIFQLVERNAGRQQPIAEVWDDIQTFLIAQQLTGAIEELRAEATIDVFPDRMEDVEQ